MNWITDKSDARVQAALAWSCDLCKARIKHLCTNTITAGAPLPGRVVHFARLIDRRKAKSD